MCTRLGEVTAFITDANEQRVFRQTELKFLLFNNEVANINGISRKELLATYNRHIDNEEGFTEVHKTISRFEITWEGGGIKVERQERVTVWGDQIDARVDNLLHPTQERKLPQKQEQSSEPARSYNHDPEIAL